MTDQPQESASVEDRLTAFFQPPEVAKEAPVEAQAEETTQETVEEPEAPVEDDAEEFEVDGETYRLPKTLKSKVAEWREGQLRQDDYTRKTQELAEMRKQVAMIAEAAQQRDQFEASIKNERAEMERIKSQLEGFKNLDWNALDADVLNRVAVQRSLLQDKLRELEGTVGQKADQFRRWNEGKRREVIQQGQRYLQQTIKGWGKEAVQEVSHAAQAVGYTAEELETVYDARFVRLAHKAAQYDKLMSQKEQAVGRVAKAPPVVKPGVGSGQGAAKVEKYKSAREQLRKSGSLDDAARLFLMKG